MHGITDDPVVRFPVLTGFSVYLQPLLIGARDMALPRLNAFTYWVFLFSGIFLYASLAMGAAPDATAGSTTCPMRCVRTIPGRTSISMRWQIFFSEFRPRSARINFIVTLLHMRAPGMSINRLPIMSWGTLTISVGNVLCRSRGQSGVLSALDGSSFWRRTFSMSRDRRTAAALAASVLDVGHPWVYVIVLPALSMVSQALAGLLPTPLVGYSARRSCDGSHDGSRLRCLAPPHVCDRPADHGACVLQRRLNHYCHSECCFTLAWLATIWTGRPVFIDVFCSLPGLWSCSSSAGVSGFMTGAVPVDWQFTDTYFVVAHIHYVLIGWNLFPVIGALYFWFPKMTGRMLDERLGRWNFWLMFLGFNIGFFPMHVTGLLGMPRRVYTYPEGMGWSTLNLITSIGSFVLAFGILLTLDQCYGQPAGGQGRGPEPVGRGHARMVDPVSAAAI